MGFLIEHFAVCICRKAHYLVLIALIPAGCAHTPSEQDTPPFAAQPQQPAATQPTVHFDDVAAGPLAFRVFAPDWTRDGLRVVMLIVNAGRSPVTIPLPVVRDDQGRVYEPAEQTDIWQKMARDLTGLERLNPQQAIYAESFFPMPKMPGCQLIVHGPAGETAAVTIPPPSSPADRG